MKQKILPIMILFTVLLPQYKKNYRKVDLCIFRTNNKNNTKTICDYNRSWVITSSSHHSFVILLFSIEFLFLPLKSCHKPTLQFLTFGNKREIQMLTWDWECFQPSTYQTAVCRLGNQIFYFVPILNTLWKVQTRYQSALNHSMEVLLCMWTQGGVNIWSAIS